MAVDGKEEEKQQPESLGSPPQAETEAYAENSPAAGADVEDAGAGDADPLPEAVPEAAPQHEEKVAEGSGIDQDTAHQDDGHQQQQQQEAGGDIAEEEEIASSEDAGNGDLEAQRPDEKDPDAAAAADAVDAATAAAAPHPLTRESTFSHTAVMVPRAERRGLFGGFAIIPEIERPYDYKNGTKWTITLIVALAGAGAPIGSAIFYPALPEIAVDLNTTPTTTNLAVAFYMLAMSIFPLWWSSFSETLGRRTIYIVSFALFVVFSVLSALSVNIAMLIVMRILGGGAAASVQAVGAGTIADVWETRERGRAMGLFYLGPLAGPLLAPIIGGALAQGFGWRSTMWFIAIYGGVMWFLIFFGLPETLKRKTPPPVAEPPAPQQQQDASGQPLQHVSTAQSIKSQTKRATRIFYRFVLEPLEVLKYMRYPPVLVAVYSGAIAFGTLYILNISIQSTFSKEPYNFSTILVGLLYLAPSIGYWLASLIGGRWIDRIMAREAERAGRYDAQGRLIYLPEDRMRENIWLAATMYPGALIWYGWTAQHGVIWIVPSIANFFFGFGSMLVFGAVTTMLTEFMPQRSSSGVAINNFVRNIFSCIGAVITQPLINAMGVGWLFTMVGLLAWITGNAAIWALRRWGPEWRAAMDRGRARGQA